MFALRKSSAFSTCTNGRSPSKPTPNATFAAEMPWSQSVSHKPSARRISTVALVAIGDQGATARKWACTSLRRFSRLSISGGNSHSVNRQPIKMVTMAQGKNASGQKENAATDIGTLVDAEEVDHADTDGRHDHDARDAGRHDEDQQKIDDNKP